MDELAECEAIRELLSHYTYYGDRARLYAMAATFAEDGVLEMTHHTGVGPDGIKAALSGGGAVKEGVAFIRHHISSPQIEIATDGMMATARSYFCVYSTNGPDHSGVYNDLLIKTPKGWRFQHRRVRTEWRAAGSVYGEG